MGMGFTYDFESLSSTEPFPSLCCHGKVITILPHKYFVYKLPGCLPTYTGLIPLDASIRGNGLFPFPNYSSMAISFHPQRSHNLATGCEEPTVVISLYNRLEAIVSESINENFQTLNSPCQEISIVFARHLAFEIPRSQVIFVTLGGLRR